MCGRTRSEPRVHACRVGVQYARVPSRAAPRGPHPICAVACAARCVGWRRVCGRAGTVARAGRRARARRRAAPVPSRARESGIRRLMLVGLMSLSQRALRSLVWSIVCQFGVSAYFLRQSSPLRPGGLRRAQSRVSTRMKPTSRYRGVARQSDCACGAGTCTGWADAAPWCGVGTRLPRGSHDSAASAIRHRAGDFGRRRATGLHLLHERRDPVCVLGRLLVRPQDVAHERLLLAVARELLG